MSVETTQTQCHAITENGERCERPAGEDGFCHQHDESDETIEEYDGGTANDEDAESANEDGGATTGATNDEAEGNAENGEEGTAEGSSDSESDEEGSGSDTSNGPPDVRGVRETVQSLVPEVIGRKLDAVIEVDDSDEGWQAVVEVVERRAVPDTQDILGRYEIDLTDGAVTGYRRVDRYRRSDMDAGGPP